MNPTDLASQPPGPAPRLGFAFTSHVLLLQIVIMVARITTTYRAVELELSVEWLGAIAGSFSLLPLLVAIVAGTHVDKKGERSAMIAGAIIMLAGTLGLLLPASSALQLIMCNLLLGLGQLLLLLTQHSIAAGDEDAFRRDIRFGHYTALVSLGQIFAPLGISLVGGAGTLPNTTYLFIFAAALAALNLGIVLIIKIPPRPPKLGNPIPVSIRDLLRIRGLLPAILTGIAVLCAIDIMLIYLPVLGTEANIEAGVIGYLMMGRAVSSLLSRMVFRWLILVAGRRLLLTLAIASAGLGVGLLGLHIPVWAMAIAMVIAGFGIGIGTPLTLSWVTGIVPSHTRALVLSMRLTGNRLGQVGLPVIVGFVVGGTGVSVAFFAFAAILTALAATTFATFERNRQQDD